MPINLTDLLTGRAPVGNMPNLNLPKPVGPVKPVLPQRRFYKYSDSQEVFDDTGHHYKSMAELQAAGGAGKVQVINRTNPNVQSQLTGKLPLQGAPSTLTQFKQAFTAKPIPAYVPPKLPESVFPDKGNILQRGGNFVGRAALNFLEPVGERAGSIIRSAQTKSLQPLKDSFNAQNKEFGPKKATETTQDYLKRISNIALIANVDAGLGFGEHSKPKLNIEPTESDSLTQEARKYKSADEFKQNITSKQLREVLNNTSQGKAKTASSRATGATSRKAGDYLYAQDRGAFDAMLDDLKTGRNPKEEISSKLTDIWNKTNSQEGFIDPSAVGRDIKKGAGVASEKLKTESQKFKTEVIDKYNPIKELVKDTKLNTNKDPYVAARLFAGQNGKVENRLDELSKILTPHKNILEDTKQFMLYERYEELFDKKGITKFPGGLKIDEIRAKRAALESKLGSNKDELVKGIRSFQDKSLDEAVDGGIISKETRDSIKKSNEKYIPLQRLEYLAEHGDSLPAGSKSFSVATQNIIKTIKGSEKEIVDPLESIVRNVYKTTNLVERNKVGLKVADLHALPEFKDTVIPIKNGQVPAGMEKFSVFRNGIKEDYAVPKDVGEAMKNLNKQSADFVTKWAKLSSSALRAGATNLNLAFIPSNMIRDYQTATITSKGLRGFTPLDWLKGFGEAIQKGDDYKQFLESGGASGYFEINKKLPKTVKNLTQSKTISAVKTILNPFQLLKKMGEITELAPRLGVFKKTLKNTGDATEAAFAARNATVDFAKSGNTVQVLNQWVPFLNARLQGNLNMFKAIKERPGTTALKIGALVGIPAVATYEHNQNKYPEIWNDISDTDKHNNFIIIYGNKKDEKGNPTQVIKIPKGDAKIFANPLEEFLDYLHHKDTKSLKQIAIETGSDISPVDFARDGKIDPGFAGSNLLPPTVKGGIESITNKNLYTGRDIVPQSLKDASPQEQYDDRTSTLAKELGKFLGWSPKKIDNFIGTQFGGAGRQISNPKSAVGQITGRFSGAYGGQQEQNLSDEAKKAVQVQADKKLETKRQAQKLLDRFSQETPSQAAQDFEAVARANSELAKAITSLKEKKDLNFSNKDYVIDELGVENGERAKFLKGQFDKLKTKEEKAALWDDLVKKKLITKQVSEQMAKLLKSN